VKRFIYIATDYDEWEIVRVFATERPTGPCGKLRCQMSRYMIGEYRESVITWNQLKDVTFICEEVDPTPVPELIWNHDYDGTEYSIKCLCGEGLNLGYSPMDRDETCYKCGRVWRVIPTLKLKSEPSQPVPSSPVGA
jgi:hypothetical protein